MSTLLRNKCPSCGHVADVPGNYVCPKCKNNIDLNSDGIIQIYRMGSPIGVAAGYGIYINGNPCGHIGNKQSIRIPVPFGKYTLHFTCGATRKCQDVTVDITPENSNAYVKVHIKPGFWTNCIIAETATAQEMPAL